MSVPLIRQLVDLHRRQLFGVIEIRGVGRLHKLYADSRLELEDKLARLARVGRARTFEAQHLRMVLVQVADAARHMEAQLVDHMRDTGRMAGILAPRHVVNMVGKLEERYGRMTPVVQAAQAAVVRGVYPHVAPTLLDRYRESAKRYGPPAMSAIREGLARSIVQEESVEEAIGRVSGATGLYGAQEWRAARIVRTEMSWSYGISNQRSMEELAPAVPKMQKRLVATIDGNTGDDSKELNGQTVPVDQPFLWQPKDAHGNPKGPVIRYMQPPNRPNDRECVIPWLPAWGTGGLAAPGPVEPVVPDGL